MGKNIKSKEYMKYMLKPANPSLMIKCVVEVRKYMLSFYEDVKHFKVKL